MLGDIPPASHPARSIDEHGQTVSTVRSESDWEVGRRAAGHTTGGAIIILTQGCWKDEKFKGAVDRLVGGPVDGEADGTVGPGGSLFPNLYITYEADPRFRGEVRRRRAQEDATSPHEEPHTYETRASRCLDAELWDARAHVLTPRSAPCHGGPYRTTASEACARPRRRSTAKSSSVRPR